MVNIREPQAENVSPPTDKASLRSFISAFVKRCDVQYQGCEPTVADFEARCIEEASARGYLGGDDDALLRRSIEVGASMGAAAYPHRDDSLRMYIALYTAFATYLDDVISSQLDAIRAFVPRLVANEPQKLKVLDDFAALLLDMPKFCNPVTCNIILTSTIDFVNSLLIQCSVLGVPMPTSASEYPMFFRRWSGIGIAFVGFIFPPEMPAHSWVRAIPDIACWICTTNDVLSFYKEDMDGEVEDTLIWLIARNRNISVYESLCNVANEAVVAHHRVLRTLEAYPDAHEAYGSFAHGYHGFHVESKRYRLQELAS